MSGAPHCEGRSTIPEAKLSSDAAQRGKAGSANAAGCTLENGEGEVPCYVYFATVTEMMPRRRPGRKDNISCSGFCPYKSCGTVGTEAMTRGWVSGCLALGWPQREACWGQVAPADKGAGAAEDGETVATTGNQTLLSFCETPGQAATARSPACFKHGH